MKKQNLSEAELEILYYVYRQVGDNVYQKVETDLIFNCLLTEDKTQLISDCLKLNELKLIKFNSWSTGIYISVQGINYLEQELLTSEQPPSFLSADQRTEISLKIYAQKKKRTNFVKQAAKLAQNNPVNEIPVVDLVKQTKLDENEIWNCLIPYSLNKGWICGRSLSSISVTESGLLMLKNPPK